MRPINRFARKVHIAALIVFVSFSTVTRADTVELVPGANGDDTAQLQAAIANCSNTPCNIRLGAGVFYTDVLLAKGFRGSISGSGQGRTIIRPLAHRPLRSTPVPFQNDPTLDQPYPALLHFTEGGKISLSKFTMEFPADMTVMPYDLLSLESDITRSLIAAILVDGDRNAELQMTQVTIIGADNESLFGSNISSAVNFEGKIRYSNGNDVTGADQTRKLQRAQLTAHNNKIQRSGLGFLISDADHLEGFVMGNDFDVRIYAVYTADLGASRMVTALNDIRAELEGVLMAQNHRPPEVASDYVVALNRIRVNENGGAIDGQAFDGVGVFDFAALAESIKANVIIWGNDITLGENVIAGVSIDSDGPGAVRVVANRIRGPATEAGVRVALSQGTLISSNNLRGVDAPHDVHLLSTTRECRVIQPGATVLDEGTNNTVITASQ